MYDQKVVFVNVYATKICFNLSSISLMASSSTSSLHKSYQFDVFLSFSGNDTRRTFIDHLYDALHRQGIHTFKDDEKLEKGKTINRQLLKAIEDSRFYIIVFSKKYASSSWCLNELVKIMECQKTNEQSAYPVFYDVDPSEVRKQRGPVGEALAIHKNELEVAKWREALKKAANLSGWDLRKTADGHEAKVIKLIVEHVSLELRSINVNVDENLIGMEQRMRDLEPYLEIGLDDVRMIGIKGMGGAGKTTLARSIFDSLSIHFEARSFVENVREVSKASMSGLRLLQKQVLSDVLNDKHIDLSSVHDGKNMMKMRLRGKKVLVVLDDVDHKDQLEALAGEPNWFKPGSRIIITTRDEQVLIAHRVKCICDVALLSDVEANFLFSRHAFGGNFPNHEYEMLSLKAVHYAAGLPLTIKVLGSFLCGKDKPEWIDALARLKTIPLKETLEKLELSYESLEDDYKEIFLDVACLLKGWRKDEAIVALESCGFHARNGLRVLQQKSLINIKEDYFGDYLVMHDHVEEMGKNIVRRLHPDDPSKHSHLWIQEEIEDIFANDLAAEDTRYINLKLTPEIVVEGLGNMKKLRCLVVDYKNDHNYLGDHLKIDEASQYFPNALRYLNWSHYPHWCLPKSFQANYLVALVMYNSKVEQLWEGGKVLKKLKSLELCCSKLRILDLGLTPNLERLDLQECFYLSELHVRGGCLKSLLYLNLFDCATLPSRSFIKHLESLEVLNVDSLTMGQFQDIIPRHHNSSLLKLYFVSKDIEELPSSIGNLHKLTSLNLTGCYKLKSLPGSFSSLQHLRTLYLDSCGIEQLPEDLGQLESLEELDLSWCKIRYIPSSICNLKRLKKLHLPYCNQLEKLPEKLGDIESLEVLTVHGTSISHLPKSISLLKGLEIIGYKSRGSNTT